MKSISEKGTLTPLETARCMRDYFLLMIVASAPYIIDTLLQTDFGDYNFIIQLALGGVIFLNRKYNWWRVDENTV